MRLTLDGDWGATGTGNALRVVPRFGFREQRVRIATYADVEDRQNPDMCVACLGLSSSPCVSEGGLEPPRPIKGTSTSS